MNRFHERSAATLAIALLLAGPAAAAGPAYEWISEPAQLAARGFAPDGPPIRRLVADRHGPSAETLLAARRAQRAALKSSPVDVGGAGVRWAAVQGVDFKFLNESAPYSTTGNFVIHGLAGSPNRFADAPILLRDDHRIDWLDVWSDDTNATDSVDVALYQTCHPAFAAGAPEITELMVADGGVFSGGNRFQGLPVPGGVYVDNHRCTYFVRARFSSTASGVTVQVQKVRVEWSG